MAKELLFGLFNPNALHQQVAVAESSREGRCNLLTVVGAWSAKDAAIAMASSGSSSMPPTASWLTEAGICWLTAGMADGGATAVADARTVNVSPF